jgi:hypothetical protein
MGQLVCGGALLKCSFGVAPCSLMVLPVNRVMTSMPIANIMDNVPMMNILPFGMCSSPANPTVIAAMGAPMPCVPVTPAPWVPGAPTVLVANFPALNNSAKLMCVYGGVIEILMAGQMTISVP